MNEEIYNEVMSEFAQQEQPDADDIDDIFGKDEFIRLVAERARFTQKDVRIILNTMIDIFIEAVKNKQEIFIRGFGLLYTQVLPPRKSSKAVKGGIDLPATTRVIFRLSDAIRKANKKD